MGCKKVCAVASEAAVRKPPTRTQVPVHLRYSVSTIQQWAGPSLRRVNAEAEAAARRRGRRKSRSCRSKWSFCLASLGPSVYLSASLDCREGSREGLQNQTEDEAKRFIKRRIFWKSNQACFSFSNKPVLSAGLSRPSLSFPHSSAHDSKSATTATSIHPTIPGRRAQKPFVRLLFRRPWRKLDWTMTTGMVILLGGRRDNCSGRGWAPERFLDHRDNPDEIRRQLRNSDAFFDQVCTDWIAEMIG